MNPLTKNIHSIKDLFKAADHIHSIPTKLFDKAYGYFFFDVTLLFTNVPLNKTINIILQRINKEKLAKRYKRKSTLKMLIKGSCTKIAFLLNDKIYKQIHAVMMGWLLGPIFTNLIMTEIQRLVVDKLGLT